MCFNGISEEKLKSSIRACFPCKGSHDTEWVFGLHAFRRSLVWSICVYIIYGAIGCYIDMLCRTYGWKGYNNRTYSNIPIHAMWTEHNIIWKSEQKAYSTTRSRTVIRRRLEQDRNNILDHIKRKTCEWKMLENSSNKTRWLH